MNDESHTIVYDMIGNNMFIGGNSFSGGGVSSESEGKVTLYLDVHALCISFKCTHVL